MMEDIIKPNTSNKGKNVLVVDDEQGILDAFKRMLEMRGYTVFCAKDSFQALEIAHGKRVDFAFIDILIDLKLPGSIDGVATFKKLRQSFPDMKAVVMTGFSVEEQIAEAMRSGALGIIRKPFDNDQIYRLLDQNLLN